MTTLHSNMPSGSSNKISMTENQRLTGGESILITGILLYEDELSRTWPAAEVRTNES